MSEQIQSSIDQYWSWLRDKTKLREIEDWIEITTPYLDRHNDYLQIYAKNNTDDGIITLTDDSYIIQDLKHSGCDLLKSQKRKDILQEILNGFGVQGKGNSLVVHTSRDRFSRKKHDLVQAMLAINDLFYLASTTIKSIFLEDVANWLTLSEIRYISSVKITGKSGYDHVFNFVIPQSRQAPERFIKAISHPSRDRAEAVAFQWIDTREVRDPDSQAYAILNDTDFSPRAEIFEALQNYEVSPILWSQRERHRMELAA